MITTEILTEAEVAAMPDAELLHRMQRLRRNVDAIKAEIAAFEESAYGRKPDWSLRAKDTLKDWEAALKQVREEGGRRLAAVRGAA